MYSLSYDMTLVMEMSYDLVLNSDSLLSQNSGALIVNVELEERHRIPQDT